MYGNPSQKYLIFTLSHRNWVDLRFEVPLLISFLSSLMTYHSKLIVLFFWYCPCACHMFCCNCGMTISKCSYTAPTNALMACPSFILLSHLMLVNQYFDLFIDSTPLLKQSLNTSAEDWLNWSDDRLNADAKWYVESSEEFWLKCQLWKLHL